jgi:prepilin-type processing-associated H-X9-DG protein
MACSNNLKQLALACHNHHDANANLLPTSCTADAVGSDENAWSYAVQILPYIEHSALYDLWLPIKISLGRNSSDVSKTKINSFLCPSDSGSQTISTGQQQATNYSSCAADYSYRWKYSNNEQSRGALCYRVQTGLSAISDGTSNTILFSERLICEVAGSRVVKQGVVINTTAVPAANNTADGNFNNARADLCMGLRPSSGSTYSSGTSVYTNVTRGGLPWTSGSTIVTHFNTINPPNAPTCGSANDCANPAIISPTSNHPGGVNCAFSDGSVFFINDMIKCLTESVSATAARPKKTGASDFGVWGALGTKQGDESQSIP